MYQKTAENNSNFIFPISGPPALLNCTPLRRYTGHRDGIWEVSVSRMRLPILGTASADHTSIIWGMLSGQALLQYTGHAGSVNSLRFHPNKVNKNLVQYLYQVPCRSYQYHLGYAFGTGTITIYGSRGKCQFPLVPSKQDKQTLSSS